MPKLWDETIEEHRRSVRQATLDTTAKLVAQKGLRAVTMSEIAENTGIGRATLYKYFPDVESIIAAWHQRQIDVHLAELEGVCKTADSPMGRLEAVFNAYAGIQHRLSQHRHGQLHGRALATLLHAEEAISTAQGRLHGMVTELIEDAAHDGGVRSDVPPHELAAFCIHALDAAGHAPNDTAVTRLVGLTVAGISSGA